MLHILLTTIISYVTNIHDVNKQYRDTFTYRFNRDLKYEVLYGNDKVMYNYRDEDICDGGLIYNKFCDETEYPLPSNY